MANFALEQPEGQDGLRAVRPGQRLRARPGRVLRGGLHQGRRHRSSGKETYTKDDTDFSAILSKVAAAKPDVLFLPDYYNMVNLIGKQAKEKGITAPMMGGDGWDSADLDVKAADGGFYSNHYDAE